MRYHCRVEIFGVPRLPQRVARIPCSMRKETSCEFRSTTGNGRSGKKIHHREGRSAAEGDLRYFLRSRAFTHYHALIVGTGGNLPRSFTSRSCDAARDRARERRKNGAAQTLRRVVTGRRGLPMNAFAYAGLLVRIRYGKREIKESQPRMTNRSIALLLGASRFCLLLAQPSHRVNAYVRT